MLYSITSQPALAAKKTLTELGFTIIIKKPIFQFCFHNLHCSWRKSPLFGCFPSTQAEHEGCRFSFYSPFLLKYLQPPPLPLTGVTSRRALYSWHLPDKASLPFQVASARSLQTTLSPNMHLCLELRDLPAQAKPLVYGTVQNLKQPSWEWLFLEHRTCQVNVC